MHDLHVSKQKWPSEIKAFNGRRCAFCGSENRPEAHHIKPQGRFPDLATSIDNGIVLCHECHFKLHYAGRQEIQHCAEEEMAQIIRIIVPKGRKADIEAHAAKQNQSLNEFINRAIDETIQRDNAGAEESL